MQWFRHYLDASFDPKFRTASRRADQTIERVVFVWWALCEHAATTSGDISGFDPDIVADHLMCDVTAVTACVTALEKGGLLGAKTVRNWSKRQYNSDTSAERTRRWREKKKADCDDVGDVTVTSHVTDVTDQNRTEQIKESSLRSDSGGAARSPAKRKRQIPPDWWPDEAGQAYARERGVPQSEVSHFRDFHRAKGNTFADFAAAWRTWCNNYNHPRFQRSKSNGRHENFQDAAVRALIDACEDREQAARELSADPSGWEDHVPRLRRGN